MNAFCLAFTVLIYSKLPLLFIKKNADVSPQIPAPGQPAGSGTMSLYTEHSSGWVTQPKSHLKSHKTLMFQNGSDRCIYCFFSALLQLSFLYFDSPSKTMRQPSVSMQASHSLVLRYFILGLR